jgi:hypothetical protein
MCGTVSMACRDVEKYLSSLDRVSRDAVQAFMSRVDDWKGHCVCTFGPLLRFGKFTISRSTTVDPSTFSIRQYHIYLFSNILLCCRKRSRKDAYGRDLALKGRIFLRNVKEMDELDGMLRSTSDTSMRLLTQFCFTQACD